MKNRFGRGSRRRLYLLASAALWIVLAQPAKAVDEIQVYNAGIAAPGQFTIQQHLNYIPLGVKDPPFPGGLVNPIVDIGFGRYGQADFTPAARLARKLGPDLFVGLEYYADFGEIGNFLKPADQQHTLFAVTDFKLGVFGVNFGVGYGLTPASD